jgi:hypothetical protein
MAEARKSRAAPPGLLGGVVFFIVVAAGCGYIVVSKLHGFAAVQVTLVPVAVMVGYALLLGLARLFRLRDDQSGDNLYYMGFLFTLTSLGVSLYQYSSEGSPEQIVQNFGIAIASTIAGIALRIFFNQMRRDPVEVEQTARLELADASRKVKRELDSTVLEFGYFRRTIQQSIEDSLAEMKELLKEAKNNFVGQLGEFAEDSSKPIEEAARKSGTTIEVLSTRISKSLDEVAVKLSDAADRISASAAATAKSLDGIVRKLENMQTPEQVIEIKLSPAIQAFTRAVNNFSKNADVQAKAVDDNIKQTQALVASVTQLVAEVRAAESARNAGPAVQASVPRPPGAAASPDPRQQAARTEPGPTRNT